MKRLFLILLLLAIGFPRLQAQQDPLVSMYMFNQLLVNPAYAGSREHISTRLLHRSQWVTMDGAPSTQILTAHGLMRGDVNALGVQIANDKIGVTNQTDFYGYYAYHIPMEKMTLSLGLRGGLGWYNVNFEQLEYWDQGDPVYQTGRQSAVMPNAGAGAYLYAERFFVGVSVPSLMSYDPNELFAVDLSKVPRKRRHYLISGGVALKASDDIVFKPSFLFRYVKNAPPQADLNLNVLLYERLWIGASYRTGDAVVGMAEFLITKKFRVGYSFDYTLSQLSGYTYGSHELMLGYDLGFDAIKMKTPRYF